MNKILPEETIAINGSHDCSCTFIDKNKKLRIYEYERLVKIRYAIFSKKYEGHRSQGIKIGTTDKNRNDFLTHIKNNLYTQNIKLVLHHDMFSDQDLSLLKTYFPNAELKYSNHHESHAYCAQHQSNFDDCLIFSVDGGGRDNDRITTTNVYLYRNKQLKSINCPNIDIGNPYNNAAKLLKDVTGLGPAGKLMGLAGYGNVIKHWKDTFRSFYGHGNSELLQSGVGVNGQVDGQVAWDIARMTQYTFEEILFDLVKKHVDVYNTNVILTGGCALNVLFNQRLYEYLKLKNLNLYVPPNPSDCGLSYGMFVKEHRDFPYEEICFSGFEILDSEKLSNYKNPSVPFSLEVVTSHLKNGKILAIVDGLSEVGPRALGNRSIICYPAFPEMKDVLNSKVKFRQWYRPFAPVCKYENRDVYFENAPNCNYMSYAPKVKESWRSKLPSITHVDGTSRLQTVTNGCLFYDILSHMEKDDMIPVLLNTSFNIKGMPILTTLEDAFNVLNNTQLDFLIYNGRIYSK